MPETALVVLLMATLTYKATTTHVTDKKSRKRKADADTVDMDRIL